MVLTVPHSTRRLLVSGTVLGACLVASLAQGTSPDFRPAPEPGSRSLDLQYFQLEPTSEDSVYNLLVIPVRFPEDQDLGRTREELEQALNGDGIGSLGGYYRAATGGRLRIESALAPTVVADHSRSFYTVEGVGNLGYGLDPNAYPHNARFLAEEVTAKVVFDVDFKRFDNTGDGIVDGLLLVHSGPRAPEVPEPGLSRDHLLAHSFTLAEAVERGNVMVFPYSVVAARDPIGPLAHEVGHLFGLPDLYVANGFCPGPGIGDWSLMATGASRAGGEAPPGLDAFSLQLMGINPVISSGEPFALTEGAALRVFRAGEEPGPEYFLVERRTGADGLGLDEPATVIYHVDERAGDNRSCNGPRLVEVRAELCAGTGGCVTTLSDLTTPGLRDGDGQLTHLVLDFTRDAVLARFEALPMVRLDRVRLLPPTGSAGPPDRQGIEVTVSNLDLQNSRSATLDLARSGAGETCPVVSVAPWVRNLAPGEVLIDTTWSIVACVANDPLPTITETYTFTISETGTGFTRVDTLLVPVNQVGLPDDSLSSFTSSNLNPPRDEPWSFAAGQWSVSSLDNFAHGELASPWFSVPEGGVLQLDHLWDLKALSPDVALDAGQVRIRRPLFSDRLLSPSLGWGFTAERQTGNALAGKSVLCGSGDRLHVLNLNDFAGDIVQIILPVAGDVEEGEAIWNVNQASVEPGSEITFELIQDPQSERVLVAKTTSPEQRGVTLNLYEGRLPVTPTIPLAAVEWDGSPQTELATARGLVVRYELIWRDSQGRAGSSEVNFTFSSPTSAGPILLPPYPNPLREGGIQNWVIRLADDVPAGNYDLVLVTVTGRDVRALAMRVDVAGTRTVRWDGRDYTGRNVSSGVYFLQVRRPDGTKESQKVVVIP